MGGSQPGWIQGDRPPDVEENPESRYCQRLGGQVRLCAFQIHSRKTRITQARAPRLHPPPSQCYVDVKRSDSEKGVVEHIGPHYVR